LFYYKLSDLLFNVTVFYSIFLGLFFSSNSIYFQVLNRSILLLLIGLAILFSSLFFIFKKTFVHIPLEYTIIVGNKDIWFRLIFQFIPILWFCALIFTKALLNIDFNNITNIFWTVFGLPLLIFIFSTYLDLVFISIKSSDKTARLGLRMTVHLLDSICLYSVTIVGIKLVIPNLALNESLNIPFLVIIPFIYLMHQTRERVLYYMIKKNYSSKN